MRENRVEDRRLGVADHLGGVHERDALVDRAAGVRLVGLGDGQVDQAQHRRRATLVVLGGGRVDDHHVDRRHHVRLGPRRVLLPTCRVGQAATRGGVHAAARKARAVDLAEPVQAVAGRLDPVELLADSDGAGHRVPDNREHGVGSGGAVDGPRPNPAVGIADLELVSRGGDAAAVEGRDGQRPGVAQPSRIDVDQPLAGGVAVTRQTGRRRRGGIPQQRGRLLSEPGAGCEQAERMEVRAQQRWRRVGWRDAGKGGDRARPLCRLARPTDRVWCGSRGTGFWWGASSVRYDASAIRRVPRTRPEAPHGPSRRRRRRCR